MEFFILNRQEFPAQAFDLFLGCGAHIGRMHNRAQAFGCRDGLQACNPNPHDEHIGRIHATRRRGHHR